MSCVCVQWSPDDKMLASGGNDNALILWQVCFLHLSLFLLSCFAVHVLPVIALLAVSQQFKSLVCVPSTPVSCVSLVM